MPEVVILLFFVKRAVWWCILNQFNSNARWVDWDFPLWGRCFLVQTPQIISRSMVARNSRFHYRNKASSWICSVFVVGIAGLVLLLTTSHHHHNSDQKYIIRPGSIFLDTDGNPINAHGGYYSCSAYYITTPSFQRRHRQLQYHTITHHTQTKLSHNITQWNPTISSNRRHPRDHICLHLSSIGTNG